MGKTADNGTVSVFSKTGVTVYKVEDVLITCKGEPILIGVQDKQGRYQIPLMQTGQWQPRHPSKQARKALRQANSIYDLLSTKQAIKWMHAICGYPVKLTWLEAIKAGNYGGCAMLTERNNQKHYPKATETAKGHLNQTKKSTFPQRTTCPIQKMQHISTPWQESTQCIPQNVQGTQNHVLQPNRPVPYRLATRQQIHHGDG